MAGSLVERFGLQVPVIGGAMYPCSNPELVAAVSAAGGIGVLQPVTLVYVCGLDFRDGVRRIRQLTDRPIGMNVITERSSQRYLERMSRWLDVALEEGVRFFVTSLGDPRWIVDRVHPAGGVVYPDVTERKWALKARDAGVDGLIGVNNLAGGHAGARSRIKAIANSMRDLSQSLHPALLDELGLLPALEWYIGEWKRESGIDVRIVSAGFDKQPPRPVAVALYRVVQECLANVRKHSGASRVKIVLAIGYPHAILRCEDNGKGFSSTGGARKKKGLGLVSMRERVEFLGGSFQILSSPGKGTRVRVKIPLKAHNAR